MDDQMSERSGQPAGPDPVDPTSVNAAAYNPPVLSLYGFDQSTVGSPHGSRGGDTGGDRGAAELGSDLGLAWVIQGWTVSASQRPRSVVIDQQRPMGANETGDAALVTRPRPKAVTKEVLGLFA